MLINVCYFSVFGYYKQWCDDYSCILEFCMHLSVCVPTSELLAEKEPNCYRYYHLTFTRPDMRETVYPTINDR